MNQQQAWQLRINLRLESKGGLHERTRQTPSYQCSIGGIPPCVSDLLEQAKNMHSQQMAPHGPC